MSLIIVGAVAKKFKFPYVTALITGLILAVVCPLIGTQIGNNLIDKVGTCLFTVLIIKYLPFALKNSLNNYSEVK